MLSDEALARVAFGIAAVAGILFAAAVAFTGIAIAQIQNEESSSLQEARALIIRLYRLIMSPRGIQRYDKELDFKEQDMALFSEWLTEHQLQADEHDFGDYIRFRESTDPVFKAVSMILAQGEDKWTYKYELLRSFLLSGLDLRSAIGSIGWARNFRTKLKTSTYWVFAITSIVLGGTVLTGYLSELRVGMGIGDTANVYTAAGLVLCFALLLYKAGKHLDLVFFQNKKRWLDKQEKLLHPWPEAGQQDSVK